MSFARTAGIAWKETPCGFWTVRVNTCQQIAAAAPKSYEHLCPECADHFEQFEEISDYTQDCLSKSTIAWSEDWTTIPGRFLRFSRNQKAPRAPSAAGAAMTI